MLVAPAEDPGSVLSTYMVAYNHGKLQFQRTQQHSLLTSRHEAHAWFTNIYVSHHSYTPNKIDKSRKTEKCDLFLLK